MNDRFRLARLEVLGTYETKGIDEARKMAHRFLTESDDIAKELNCRDVGGELRGKTAELLLECNLREFVRTHEKTFMLENLCFPRMDGKLGIGGSPYTEIDMVLCTKWCMYIFECKSYFGDKVLRGDGTMCYGANLEKSYDVVAQNRMHMDNLNMHIGKHFQGGTRQFKLALFFYSEGELKDERDSKKKLRFPALTEKNIWEWISAQEGKVDVWEMEGLFKTMNELSDNSDACFAKHLQHVRSVHNVD